MQGNDYIFCLQSKAFAFWQPDSTGGITINNSPYFLNFSPDGWNDISIQNIRNLKYWGIDRTVSIPLTYVQDASQILKHIFYTLGVEESVYLVIASQQLDYTPGVSYGYWYKQIYRGEVDLSTFIHLGSKVTCTTLEDGIAKFLKSNENTTYEFPMNVPQALFVKMDGIRLHEKLNYGFTDGINYVASKYAINFPFLNAEGDSIGVVKISETNENINPVAGYLANYMNNSLNYFFLNQSSATIAVNFIGKIMVRSDQNDTIPPSASALHIQTSEPNGFGGFIFYILFDQPMTAGVTYTFDINITINVPPGVKLFMLGGTATVNDTLYKFQYLPDSVMSLKFITRNPTTYIRSFRPQYLFEQLVNRFTEANYSTAISAYFERFKNIVWTCGNAIRGFDDAVMKISWTNFFQFWDSFDSVGIIENLATLNFDSKPNLIDRTNIITLSSPAEGTFKTSIDKSYLYNELAIGYPDLNNDVGVLNGAEEWNCGMLFSVGTTKSPAKIDKISKVKAACYAIELIRVTTLAKDTTDNKADNELFVLAIDGALHPAVDPLPAYYELDRSLNASATGLLEPLTVFNLPLSPKRMIINNFSFLSSSLYLANNKILAYKSADRNNKVVSGGIVEKADVPISAMGDKFFLPLLMEGDFEAPDDLEVLLDADPLSIFSFPVDGTTYEGILSKVSVAPSSRKAQSYQFYSVPENDIKKLIQNHG